MSNLTRWEPVRDMVTLREAMDRLFDDAFTRPLDQGVVAHMPPIDGHQPSDEVVGGAALPGLKADDVQITITADVLTLRGDFKQDDDRKDATWHIREHRSGSFERSIMLPTEIQSDKAKAEFEGGVLTVTLPKAETVKPKTITIKAK